MPEEVIPAATETAAPATEEVNAPAAPLPNAFDEESWKEGSGSTEEAPAATEPAPNAPAAAAPEPPQTPTPSADLAQLKEHLGFDDWQKAKTELEALRQGAGNKPTTPQEFANESSRKLFEAWKGGKEDEVLTYLQQKKELDKIAKMDVTKATDAAEILKLSLQYKHKDLQPDEIEYLFKKNYSLPKKPVQAEDQLDEDYALQVEEWKQSVSEAERGMIIEAKLARPEIAKYQSELVMPDIPQAESQLAEPTPEELAQAKALRDAYVKDVSTGLGNFKGFTAEYKDEAVTIPVSYEATPEEKAAIQPILESLHTDFGYFGSRWLNADGKTVNAEKMAQDIFLLENQGRIFKKLANEAGTQRLEHQIKADKNIHLEKTPQRQFSSVDAQSEMDKMAATMFEDA